MKKIIRYFKNFKLNIGLIAVLILIQTVADLMLPTLMADIVDIGIVNNDISFILSSGKWMLLIAIFGTGCAVLAGLLIAKTGAGLGMQLRKKIFGKVENFSLNEFDAIGTSSLITRTTNDVTQVQNFSMVILRVFLRAPLMAVGALIMAFSKDVKLSFMLLGVIVIIALIILGFARKTIPLYKQVQTKLDQLNLILRERLIGVRVIRAFRREKYEQEKFHNANTDLTETTIKVNKIMAAMTPIMMLAFNLTATAIIWLGANRVGAGSMEVGDLMAFIQYAMQIMFSLIMMTMMFVMFPKASASLIRIGELLDIDSQLKDGTKENISSEGTISFQGVGYQYKNAQEQVLSDITFDVKPGEMTAIIGSTGSGKSTLINLIPRFYDATKGIIKINNEEIKNIKLEVLRKQLGLVPQNVYLFSGTIEDNIKYGHPSASDEDVKWAANVAQASEFIEQMPLKYKAPVSQGGTNLSGGQKQRLSIARALIRKPKIYLFDDSFSALDFKTASKLKTDLKNHVSDAAIITVAQRVTSVMDADQIVVLDKGKTVGIGTHKELLETCKVYKEIVLSQLSEEEIA